MSWRVNIRADLGTSALNVELEGGLEPLALVGPNGSGKTTLLRIIAGARAVDSGEIEVGGELLLSTSRGVDVPIEARGVGYVPQGYGLFAHLRVVDNVAFGLSLPKVERRQKALQMLEHLQCAHLADRLPKRLSGGEQQRVALARALVREPRLLLLDEPLASLDATARRAVRTFLAERLRAMQRPSIVVTHDVRDAEALGARVCVLEGGKIVQTGTVDELRAAPGTDFVAEFVR